MPLHAAYLFDPPAEPEEGEHVATAKAWLAFGDFVLDRRGDYPEAAHLAEEGWVPESDFAALEHELEQLQHDAGEALGAVAGHLLAALRARPEGTEVFAVTDGQPGDPDRDEEGDEDA